METLLEWAVKYANMNLPVFPVAYIREDGRCSCGQRGTRCTVNSKGKHPMTQNGMLEATTKVSKVSKWWERDPNYNIGIRTGDGIGVVDVDMYKAGGEDVYNKLKESGHLPHTWTVKTGRGGLHLYYRLNKIVRSRINWEPCMDWKSEGGYVIAAPSKNNGKYELLNEPDINLIAEAPEELIKKILGEGKKKNGTGTTFQRKTFVMPEIVKEGVRDDTIFRLTSALISKDLCYPAVMAAVQEENQTKGDPPLDNEEVTKIVNWCYKKYSMKDHNLDFYFMTLPYDHEGHARCLEKMYGQFYRYCDVFGWMTYNGKYWDSEHAEFALERDIAEMLKKRKAVAMREGNDSGTSACKIYKGGVNGIKGMFSSMVITSASEFDSDYYKINVNNGVIDLRTSKITKHHPSQKFTYCIKYDYKPEASMRYWNEFLDNVIVLKEIKKYIQVLMGYAITGLTTEECLIYIFGPPRSGKGTFTETIQCLLGEPISTEVDIETFVAKRGGDSQNFDLAGLRAARVVFASESQDYVHSRFNASKIKSLTGGNKTRCCFKGKDFFSYKPQHLIIITSNNEIPLDPDDLAAWSRVRSIEFPISFLGTEDKSLKIKMRSKDNLEGVLRWMVEAAKEWFDLGKAGLKTPDLVKELTDRHRENQDDILQFLNDSYIDWENIKDFPDEFIIPIPTNTIYKEYKEWATDTGFRVKPRNSFTKALENKGLRSRRVTYEPGKRMRSIIGIKAAPTE